LSEASALPSLLAFALTAFIIEITPGPNMGYLAALSLSRGVRAGLACVAGIALGLSVYGVAAIFGLSAVIEGSPLLYEVLRWGGVAYLLYLAWEAWSADPNETSEAGRGADDLPRTAFRRGLITNLLNPKAAVFYAAVLPDFVRVDQGAVVLQMLTLTAIYVGIATGIHLLIVLLAGQLQGMIATPDRVRRLGRVFAIMLAAIAVWFAFSTRQ
jgi:threonine/homoserine/homoserine lactone efflux protein